MSGFVHEEMAAGTLTILVQDKDVTAVQVDGMGGAEAGDWNRLSVHFGTFTWP